MCAVCIRLGVLDGFESAVCILNEVCGMYRDDRLGRNFCSNYYGCGEIMFWLNYVFGTDLNLLD